MRKRIASLALCFLMPFASGSVQAFAAESGVSTPSATHSAVSPFMDYIARVNCGLSIASNGVATVKSSVYGYLGTTTSVKINANLQQYKNGRWTTIKTFTTESDLYWASLSGTYSVTKGYSYRVQATITAYNGSSAETRTVTSDESNY